MVRLVGEHAVADLDHPVAPVEHSRVVRGHEHARRRPAASSASASITRLVLASSWWLVGSSAMSRVGAVTRRPGDGGPLLLAERGLLRRPFAERTDAQHASITSATSRAGVEPSRNGRPTFSAIVNSGSRPSVWGTIASRDQSGRVGIPSIVPSSGVSPPTIRFSSVVLPEPDGPTSAVIAPDGQLERRRIDRGDDLTAAVIPLGHVDDADGAHGSSTVNVRRSASQETRARRSGKWTRTSGGSWIRPAWSITASSVPASVTDAIEPSRRVTTWSTRSSTRGSWVATRTVMPSFARPLDGVEDPVGADRVELGGRLVGDDDRRRTDGPAGERQALLLAAGQLLGQMLGPVGEPERAEHLLRLVHPGAAPLGDPHHLVEGGEVAEQVVAGALVDVGEQPGPHPAASTAGQPDQVDAVDRHVTGGRFVESADHPQQRRLAAPRRPDDRHRTAGVDRQIDAAHRLHPTGRRFEHPEQADALDHGTVAVQVPRSTSP